MAIQPKVAVILLGNMRSFNITYRNMEAYLLQPYNCDLYIFTYDKRFNSKYGENIKEEIMSEVQIRSIYGRYIKHLTIIHQDSFVERFTRMKDKSYRFEPELDRLYTIQKLAMLAHDIFKSECSKNNRHYDYIIRMRPDILLSDKFNINLSMNDNQIVVPANDSGGGFNDHIAYGKPRVMTKYLTYYRAFHDIDRIDGGRACDVSIVEAGLKKHLEVSGLNIIRYPIKYSILRDIKPQKIIFTGNKNGQYFVKKY